MIELKLVKSYSCEAREDSTLGEYLVSESMEKNDCVSMEYIDGLIKREIKVHMYNSRASSRMKKLFIRYNALLRRHGFS